MGFWKGFSCKSRSMEFPMILCVGNSGPLSIIFNIHPIIQESYNTPLEHVNCLSDLFEN